MGTTSDKLTYLNTTKTKIKDAINLANTNITNETFRQYESKIKQALINTMNDKWGVWDNFEKVIGTGETLTLNNTAQAPMKIDLKGNTSQYSTNGYQKLNQQSIKITTSGTAGAKSVDSNGYITALNTSSDGRGATYPYTDYQLTLEAGTYTLLVECTKTTTNSSSVIYIINDSNTFLYSTATFLTTTGNHTATFTLNQTTNIGITIKLYTAEARISILSSGDTYEPYTGGNPAPNPSYPEPVNVVTGDNTIEVVGKNLFDKDNVRLQTGASFNGIEDNVFTTSTISNQTLAIVKVPSNTSINILVNNNEYLNTRFYISCLKNTTTEAGYSSGWYTRAATINTTDKTNYLGIVIQARETGSTTNLPSTQELIDNLYIQITKGTTEPSTYEPYQSQNYEINLGDIELCKIGDYQDYIAKSTGKNLLDTNSMVLGDLQNDTGQEVTNTNGTHYRSGFIEVLPNTQYTFTTNYTYPSNSVTKLMEYASDKTFIGRNSSSSSNKVITFTTNSNAKYLRICMYSSTAFTNFYSLENMLNSGIQISYEPYGTQYYLHKEIGKARIPDLTGWNYVMSGLRSIFYTAALSSTILIPSTSQTLPVILATHYIPATQISTWVNGNIAIRNLSGTGGDAGNIIIVNNAYNNTTDFLNASSNSYIYYALATPTNTIIEDTELIEQLNNIENAMSYKGQTNIMQVPYDKPFILDTTLLKEV